MKYSLDVRSNEGGGGMDELGLDELQVIVPNLHWRYSGVTATNRMIAPRLARRLPTAWLGRDAPDAIARLTFRDLLRLRFRRSREPAIWHARRNNEMLAGFVLKWLGWPLALVFTSAAQRHHTWLTRFLLARMDGVLAASAAAAAYLALPATVIPHGIDIERFAPAPDRDAAYAATGLPGKYAIGCFGRVRAQKGTDIFVEAMCRLLPKYPDFTAIVIGPVTMEQRAFAAALKERVRRAGLSERVRFLGELPAQEIPRWYPRLLIYAFTSRHEGFGLTLLEAMAASAALVATRAGAAEQVVREGETGFLVPPGDADALADAIEPLMRDPARAAEIGRRGRERAAAEFSIDAEAEKIAVFYRQIRQST
jgi:mannosyltransferase